MRRDYELDDEQLELVLEHCGQAGKGVCGIDEAGRGALAGPVVAAAVVLRGDAPAGLADSKAVSAKRRDALFESLSQTALVGVGIVDIEVIDRINILEANFVAMQMALSEVSKLADAGELGSVLVDGNHLTWPLRHDCAALGATIFTVVKGDAKVQAISAASIIAKVTRDRIMKNLDPIHPGYNFAVNFGYGSPAHLAGLKNLGPSPVHRQTFAPVVEARRRRTATC
jgi:ribonuclease HII